VAPEEGWVGVEDVAPHLRVANESIHRWIDSKGFPAHRVGRLLRFKLSEVDEWVQARGGDDSGNAALHPYRTPHSRLPCSRRVQSVLLDRGRRFGVRTAPVEERSVGGELLARRKKVPSLGCCPAMSHVVPAPAGEHEPRTCYVVVPLRAHSALCSGGRCARQQR